MHPSPASKKCPPLAALVSAFTPHKPQEQPRQSATPDRLPGACPLPTRASPGPVPPRNARPGTAPAIRLTQTPGAHASAKEAAASSSADRPTSPVGATAPPALGALTDAIHAELAGHWPSRYCHRDDNAFVLSSVPSSEERQKKLIRLTIESAQRFAILTSFSVNPAWDRAPGKVSGTTFAMLESLARKQHDDNFTFVLLYNDNKLQRNAVLAAIFGQNVTANMSLKSTSHVPGTVTWPAVIESYNRQQNDERLRIGGVKCGIYFVAAKARGLAGSHHNKFCINDRGIAATLGASVANKTKDDWMDGGCIAVSTPLATSQRDYFLDVLVGGHSVQCAQLRMDGESPSMVPLKDTAPIRALAGMDVRSPLDLQGPAGAAAQEGFRAALERAGMPLEGGRHKVLWVQNPSNGCKNMFSTGGCIEGKPIGRALAAVFRSAVAGDTIDIAGKKIGTEAFSLIAEALSKGCKVNILVDRSNRIWAEQLARRFLASQAVMPPGRLTIRHYAPNEHLVQQQNLNARHDHVLHAKNYVLTRNDGSCIVMTGTYNLDGQSHYRSNENLMLFETTDTKFRHALFDELYAGSDSPVSHYPAPGTRAASFPRAAALPPGTERAAYSAVLDELQSAELPALRQVPVHYVNWNNMGYALPTHGYVVVGDPGKGRRSGAVLYGVGGDSKRGPVSLDGHLLRRLDAGCTRVDKLPEPVRAAVARLSGESFASREDFYSAYRRVRGDACDPATVHEEMSSIYRLLPMSTMELWPKRTGDYRVARPSASERDIRTFETLPKGIRHKTVLKKISGVNSIDLLEARQQFTLHQLYQDELLGRNGTGVPSEFFPPIADAGRRSALAASTPRFQWLPPYASGKVGNCNSGATSLLQRAMDKFDAPNVPGPRKATAASLFGVGSGHRIALWDPLKPRDGAGEKPPALQGSGLK